MNVIVLLPDIQTNSRRSINFLVNIQKHSTRNTFFIKQKYFNNLENLFLWQFLKQGSSLFFRRYYLIQEID